MRPEELLDILKGFIEDNNHELGFKYVAFGDGQLLPAYPAALVVHDSVTREIHGTHYFLTALFADVVIMHADLNMSRAERNRADLELATRVVRLIHGTGLSLADSRIHKSFVVNEEPSVISTDNVTAIGTSLSIIAEVREAFK